LLAQALIVTPNARRFSSRKTPPPPVIDCEFRQTQPPTPI
jgi:hypothetical protein